MRTTALLLLSLLLTGPPSRADDREAATASSSEELLSFALPSFDLNSVRTFGFAPLVGSCLGDLALGLGSVGVLAAEEREPDVVADCVVEGGDTLGVTAISLSNPRTQQIVWWGFDASPVEAPAARMARVCERLRADRSRRPGKEAVE
jgi:hypothetical protein